VLLCQDFFGIGGGLRIEVKYVYLQEGPRSPELDLYLHLHWSPLNPPKGDLKIALQINVYNKYHIYEFKSQVTKVCYRACKKNVS